MQPSNPTTARVGRSPPRARQPAASFRRSARMARSRAQILASAFSRIAHVLSSTTSAPESDAACE